MKVVTNTFLTLEKPKDLAQMEQNTHQPYSPPGSPFQVNQHARIIIFTNESQMNTKTKLLS